MSESKFYTVAEAAIILVDKGIVSKTAAEEQIRRWIRDYKKKDYHHAQTLGIKAEMQNKKTGYLIEKTELERFIKVKTNENQFDDLIYYNDSYKDSYEDFIKRVPYYAEKHEFKFGFETGFQAALAFLRERHYKAAETSKKMVKFPSKYEWYLNENDIKILSIEDEGNKKISVAIEYDNVPDLKVVFSIRNYKRPNLAFRTSIEIEDGHEISKHNERNFLKHWKLINIKKEEDKEKTEEKNQKIKMNINKMLDILQKKAEEGDFEQKLLLMMIIDSIKPLFEVEGV